MRATASAHRLDECLQAARIAIEPDHVALDLAVTPGVDVADGIIAALDRSSDGIVSPAEAREFADAVLASLQLTQDGQTLDLKPEDVTVPDLESLKRGEGTIRLRSTAAAPPQSAGDHQVTFRNRYRSDVSVYLANALVPASHRVDVVGQRRAPDQHELTIDYRMRGSESGSAWILGAVVLALAAVLRAPNPRPHRQA